MSRDIIIEADKWIFETELHVNRFRFAAAAWRDNMYIFGGQSGATEDTHPVLDIVTAFEGFDVSSSTTQTVESTTGNDVNSAPMFMVSTFLLFVITFVMIMI